MLDNPNFLKYHGHSESETEKEFLGIWDKALIRFSKVHGDLQRLQKNESIQLIRADYSENKCKDSNQAITLLYFNEEGPFLFVVYILKDDSKFYRGDINTEVGLYSNNDLPDYVEIPLGNNIMLKFPDSLPLDQMESEIFGKCISFQEIPSTTSINSEKS